MATTKKSAAKTEKKGSSRASGNTSAATGSSATRKKTAAKKAKKTSPRKEAAEPEAAAGSGKSDGVQWQVLPGAMDPENLKPVEPLSVFTDFDIQLFQGGRHYRLYEKMVAHLRQYERIR